METENSQNGPEIPDNLEKQEICEPIGGQLGISSCSTTADVEKSQPSKASSEIRDENVPQYGFDGPNDPDNAKNWGIWKKAYNTAIVGLMGLAVTFGSSVYSPGYAQVAERFHVNNTAALLPLTLYVYGLACGPVIAAPLSETYGRRFVYLTCMPLSLLFTLGAGFAQNFATLLVCRLLAGILGSPPLAVGAGTNLDMWPAISRARAVSLFLVAPFLGPALGPAVGGYVTEYKGWRWTQWTILFLGGAIWICSLGISETYEKIILAKRAKKLGKPPPPRKVPKGLSAIKYLLTVTIATPVRMLLTEPIVGLYSVYTGFNFAVLFCFFAAFPIVFQGVYGFSVGEAGLTFLGISAGCMIAALVSILVDNEVYVKRVLQNRAAGGDGHIAPENRLYSAMIGSLLLTTGLFWFAWTARADIHWISCIIATVFFACGNLLTFTSCALYLTDVYGSFYGASAMAANGIVRYILGGTFPLFTVQMYEKLGIDWATSLLGFISLALLPVPWMFFKYGAPIRKKTAYPKDKA